MNIFGVIIGVLAMVGLGTVFYVLDVFKPMRSAARWYRERVH